MQNISIYNLVDYIKENNNNNNNIMDAFLEKDNKFKIFNNISFFDNEYNFIIFESNNFVIKINLENIEELELSMIDPFSFEKGNIKTIDKKVFDINLSVGDFFGFIYEKKSYAFHYKRQILEIINNFGIECDSDLLHLNDKVNLKIEDVLSLMRDSYIRSLNIRK